MNIEQNNVNLSFITFLTNLNQSLYQYTPYKKLSKNKQTLKTKPWITACVSSASFIFSLERWQDTSFNLWIQTGEADCTIWMSFLPSYLTEKLCPNLEGFSVGT